MSKEEEEVGPPDRASPLRRPEETAAAA